MLSSLWWPVIALMYRLSMFAADKTVTVVALIDWFVRCSFIPALDVILRTIYFKPYSRSLRSSCKEYLVVPRSRLKTYGDRAFSFAGPKLWNDLPLEIRKCASVATFKQSLKTFLFKLAYRLWDSFKMFLIYIVDNLGYIWIILYIVGIL